MLDKKILNEIHTIVDELYPAKQMLRRYKDKRGYAAWIHHIVDYTS